MFNEKTNQLKNFLGLLGICLTSSLVLAAGSLPFVAITTVLAKNELERVTDLPAFLDVNELAQKSTIYGVDRKTGQPVELTSFYAKNRVDIPFDQISQFVKDAAIATEDPRFYEHGGFDIIGTTRALLMNFLRKGDTQGGSSITQQYIKNMLIQQCEAIDNAQPIQPDSDSPQTVKDEYRAALARYQRNVLARAKCVDDASGVNAGRKLREIRFAIEVTKRMDKDTVLRNYLNVVNYGGRIYGIEAAAVYYFSKHASELSLPEAATLIAIINSPQALRIDRPENPRNGEANGFARTKARRDYVIDRMAATGKITKEQQDEAKKTPITPKFTDPHYGCALAGNSAFFCDYVQHLILDNEAFGQTRAERRFNLQHGGYKIYTTLDVNMQNKATEVMEHYFPSLIPGLHAGAASITVEPGTGNILAMVQNTKYSQDPAVLEDANYSAINLNTDFEYGGSSGFQTGSTYKLFTLVDWLQKGRSLGATMNSLYNSSEGHKSFNLGDFKNSCADPGALGGVYKGIYNVKNDGADSNYTVLGATAHSINTAYMEMALQLDLCDIKNAAVKMGVRPANLDQGKDLLSSPSSVLGINYISPLRMAEAYATVAAGGRHCPSRAIVRVLDRHNKELPLAHPECEQVIPPEVNTAVAYALKSTVAYGTAAQGNPRDGIEHIAKTGTTDNAADSWTIGGSTKAVTAIWTGVTEGRSNFSQYNRSVRGQGGVYSYYYVRNNIWRETIRAADELYGGDAFGQPEGRYLVHTSSGNQVPDTTGKTEEEARQLLASAGLRFVRGAYTTGPAPRGTVVKTIPAAGSLVNRGTSIEVLLSDGSQEAQESDAAEDDPNRMPRLIGLSRQAAAERLKNFQVVFVEVEVNDETLVDKVISVSPGVGVQLEEDTVIRVTVGKAASG